MLRNQFKSSTAIQGFKSTGLFPFDFKAVKFPPAMQDEPEEEETVTISFEKLGDLWSTPLLVDAAATVDQPQSNMKKDPEASINIVRQSPSDDQILLPDWELLMSSEVTTQSTASDAQSSLLVDAASTVEQPLEKHPEASDNIVRQTPSDDQILLPARELSMSSEVTTQSIAGDAQSPLLVHSAAIADQSHSSNFLGKSTNFSPSKIEMVKNQSMIDPGFGINYLLTDE